MIYVGGLHCGDMEEDEVFLHGCRDHHCYPGLG